MKIFFSYLCRDEYPRRGYSIIEVIVAVSVVVTFFSGVLIAGLFEFRAVEESRRDGRAAFLLEEGLEAVRIVRDVSWANNITSLTSDTLYYPVYSINWKIISADPGPIDGLYTRKVVFEDVYRRDSDDDIIDVSSSDPKTLDPNTKKATVTVSWTGTRGQARSESIVTYLTNLFSN